MNDKHKSSTSYQAIISGSAAHKKYTYKTDRY